jgi:hypothetical protein
MILGMQPDQKKLPTTDWHSVCPILAGPAFPPTQFNLLCLLLKRIPFAVETLARQLQASGIGHLHIGCADPAAALVDALEPHGVCPRGWLVWSRWAGYLALCGVGRGGVARAAPLLRGRCLLPVLSVRLRNLGVGGWGCVSVLV